MKSSYLTKVMKLFMRHYINCGAVLVYVCRQQNEMKKKKK